MSRFQRFIFWKGEQRTFKNGKCQLLKINGNKLYSIFVVDSMMSNLVPISDKHKIKSAPEESVKNTQTSDGNLSLAINKYFDKIIHHPTTINHHQKTKNLRIKTRYIVQ